MLTIWPSTVWTSVAQPTEQYGQTLGTVLASLMRSSWRPGEAGARLAPSPDRPAERGARGTGGRDLEERAARNLHGFLLATGECDGRTPSRTV